MLKQEEEKDQQSPSATTTAAAAAPHTAPASQLHDHAQVLQEAASALKSLHDGESSASDSNSPSSSKRASAVVVAGNSAAEPSSTGGALQAAVEAAFASTLSAASSKKTKTTSGGSNPKKRKQIESAAGNAEDAANANTEPASQFDEEIPLTFPQRLMELLDDARNDDIIGWLPHGRGFLIYQKRRFAADIMPKYFKQSKFTSFTRKLNRWGFTRISRGPETGAYYHPYFRRGNLRLCLQMTCQSLTSKSPGNAATATASTAAGASKSSTKVASAGGTEATNTAPPSMLRHQEASAAAAQLAVPKAAQIQQSMQQSMQQSIQKQQPIGPPPALPSAQTTATAAVPGAATVPAPTPAAPTPTSAELLRTETATESVLRLRHLQRQQEQLMIRQRQIREEIQAISAALPDKIAQERRQQQLMAATAAAAAASTGTPNATPATQATPPSGTASAPSAPAAQGQDATYSRAIVDAAVEALKRSNANSYLTLLMAKQRQQQQGGNGTQLALPGAAAPQAVGANVPTGPVTTMAAPAAAAVTATTGAGPTDFQSQLRQTVQAQLDQMRLVNNQRRQQAQQAQRAHQAQQMNQAMEGITLTDDGRLKTGPGALHPAQTAAQSGTYRSCSQGQNRPSGAKRASAA